MLAVLLSGREEEEGKEVWQTLLPEDAEAVRNIMTNTGKKKRKRKN